MARYMTDIERKELKKIPRRIIRKFKRIRKNRLR